MVGFNISIIQAFLASEQPSGNMVIIYLVYDPELLCLYSGRDLLLPSIEEGRRLRQFLPKCEIRRFSDNGHFLFLVGDHFPRKEEMLTFSALDSLFFLLTTKAIKAYNYLPKQRCL